MGKGVKTLFKEASKETLAEKLAVIKEPLKIIADFSPEIDGAKACIFDVNGVEIIFAVNMKDKGYNFHLVDNDENLRLDNVVKEMFSVVKGAMCYALFAENTLIVDCLMIVINEITGKEILSRDMQWHIVLRPHCYSFEGLFLRKYFEILFVAKNSPSNSNISVLLKGFQNVNL